jgi:site-specific DNA-methyltransferase (adenine-specific)/modification methylase
MMAEKVTIGNCELYLGDCREVLPLLPQCDLILTDPPYGIGADKNLRANKQYGKAAAPSKDYGVGNWDRDPPPVWVIELMRDKSKYQIFWGGNYYTLPPAVGWLVWDKDNGDNRYADCELAWTNLQQAIRRLKWRWAGMLQQDMANKEEREHPTQKPVPVMRWALMQAKGVQTVCDPFMGSGTTGVACVMEGLQFVGIERERKYFDIACRRIEQAYAQPRLIEDIKVEADKTAAQGDLLTANDVLAGKRKTE